jgi:hypothetical protein
MWAVLTQVPFPAVAGLPVWSLTAWLFAKILIGAAVYSGVDLLLWLAAGRPEGAETRILSQGGRIMGKFKWRSLA